MQGESVRENVLMKIPLDYYYYYYDYYHYYCDYYYYYYCKGGVSERMCS